MTRKARMPKIFPDPGNQEKIASAVAVFGKKTVLDHLDRAGNLWLKDYDLEGAVFRERTNGKLKRKYVRRETATQSADIQSACEPLP